MSIRGRILATVLPSGPRGCGSPIADDTPETRRCCAIRSATRGPPLAVWGYVVDRYTASIGTPFAQFTAWLGQGVWPLRV